MVPRLIRCCFVSLQLKVEQKNQEIMNLSVAVDQLEHVRHQQAGEIDTLTKSRSQLEEKKDEAAASASAMAEELNRVKFALNDLTRRQREVTPCLANRF